MLKELYIKNIAVIDEQRLSFDSGFQVLTGETGAGKSILVESLGLILGNKAQLELIRDGADEAVVEACYDISSFPLVQNLLKQESLENTDNKNELIIKRLVRTDGQNKILINHQRASLQLLQNISRTLFDFTGQNDQSILLDSSADILILDSYLDDVNIKKDYQEHYSELKTMRSEIEKLRAASVAKSQRLDWLEFQLREFNELAVHSVEEFQELKTKREYFRNKAVIREFGSVAAEALTDGDKCASVRLNEIKNHILKRDFLKNQYVEVLSRLESLQTQLSDVAYEISRATSKNVIDDVNLDDIEAQLHQAEKLKKKYGPEITDVLQKKTELMAEKVALENSDEQIEKYVAAFEEKFKNLKSKAGKLSQARAAIVKKLEQSVKSELSFLKMADVQFKVSIETSQSLDDFSGYGTDGIDTVVFLLSPNPGLSLKPLAKIASGGETSRIFLALKKVLTDRRKNGTLIFDEVDAGVSGAVAQLVGLKLKELAKNFQVFCITHHAQIASLADQHFHVAKEVRHNQTFTRVRCLNQNERIQEVARLMGGVKISQKNLDLAKEMLTH